MQLGAVLPLTINGTYGTNDLLRAHMLFRSLIRYASNGIFEKILVVTPQLDVIPVAKSLSRWQELPIEVIAEQELLPELAHHPRMRGWRIQQLVKIAAANTFKSPFYLTLDADILCTRELDIGELVKNNKALIQTQPRNGHWKWWRASSYILNIPFVKNNPTLGMAVTPALLSTTITKGLMDEITRLGPGSWANNLCALHNSFNPYNFIPKRYFMRRWTEYSLYFLYAEHFNLLSKFHFLQEQSPRGLQLSSRAPLKETEWDIEKTFSNQSSSFFCIVNSKEYKSPIKVLDRIEAFIK